ncbi:MAG: sugar phosphate isomerase/epimerase [Gemmataceae bacterium]|nr:sugar phosphate isomerase/epimerase [Gemmataceae bacterium]
MQAISRRTAMGTAAIALAGVATGRAAQTPAGSHGMKLSLAAYGMRKYLDLKKPPAEPMDYFQFADWAADLGLGAIEVTTYYIPETTPAWLAKFKRHCTRRGLDVSGLATNTDFCVADPAKREAEVKKAGNWLAVAEYLGAKTLRVFGGVAPRGDTLDVARQRSIECLKKLCEEAPKHGVVVAVENHGGITATAEQVLALLDGVKSDWLGINLDTGNFHTADPYADLAKAAPHAVVVQMKTDVMIGGKPKTEIDMPRTIDILRAAKYRGYVALEYEGSQEPKVAIPKYIQQLRQLLAGA